MRKFQVRDVVKAKESTLLTRPSIHGSEKVGWSKGMTGIVTGVHEIGAVIFINEIEFYVCEAENKFDLISEPVQLNTIEDCLKAIFETNQINAQLNAQILSLQETLSATQSKLDSVAIDYIGMKHDCEIVKTALRAANEGNDTTDVRYAYDPLQTVKQLDSLCNGVVVHIPVEWLRSLIAKHPLIKR